MATRRRKMAAAMNDPDGIGPLLDEEGPEETPAPPGTSITLSWGEETFSPVQYNSFRVGGNTITLTVQDGESVAQAYRRGWKMLEDLAEMQFADKLKGFGDRLNRTKGR